MTNARSQLFWIGHSCFVIPFVISASSFVISIARMPLRSTPLTLGHSPDPDDAFMFYALAKELIPTYGLKFQHILQDIQTLNERALRGELDISAISIHVYAYVC